MPFAAKASAESTLDLFRFGDAPAPATKPARRGRR
jgi:hypothetical protein